MVRSTGGSHNTRWVVFTLSKLSMIWWKDEVSSPKPSSGRAAVPQSQCKVSPFSPTWSSPWYDYTGWLGVKHQVTYWLTGRKTPGYLHTPCPVHPDIAILGTGWLGIKHQVTGWLGIKRQVTYLTPVRVLWYYLRTFDKNILLVHSVLSVLTLWYYLKTFHKTILLVRSVPSV